jgi:small subunit ribosomal protein S8
MVKDNLSLMLSILINGSISYKSTVQVPSTKVNLQIINLLYLEGFIRGFSNNSRRVNVFLKYNEFLKPVIKHIKIISKSGRRVFISRKTLSKLPINKGTFFISTNHGLITSNTALNKLKIGGEVVFKII